METIKIKSKGYGIIPKLVMQDRNLTIEAKAIYSYLASYCGNKTSAYPRVETILNHLNISKSRFYAHLKLLTYYGYVIVEQEKDEHGKFSKTIYTLPNEVQKVELIESSTSIPCTQNNDTVNNPVDTIITRINNNIKDINNNNNNVDVEESQPTYEAIVNEPIVQSDIVNEVKSILPQNVKCEDNDIYAIIENANGNIHRIKKAIDVLLSYARRKVVENPIGLILSAIRCNWRVSKIKQDVVTQNIQMSTLKNYEEDERDKNYDEVMKVHQKLTVAALFD